MAKLKTRPPRRAKSDTRERLLEAALELLHRGGISAVTTVSVTHAARIVQSAFYKHFTNIEECLAIALEGVTSEIRAAVAGARQEMYDRGPGTGEDLEQSYRKMFELVKRQKPIVQLFLRYRSDPLALNGVMHLLARGLSDDLAGQLRKQFALGGIAELPAGWIEALADQLVAASLAAIEAFLENRGPAPEESARILAACSTGACLGMIESLRSRKS